VQTVFGNATAVCEYRVITRSEKQSAGRETHPHCLCVASEELEDGLRKARHVKTLSRAMVDRPLKP